MGPYGRPWQLQAKQLIHGAINQGLADLGWFHTPGQRHQVGRGQGLLDLATEALNLSELPQALHPITGVGTMVMKGSLEAGGSTPEA
jgi:hypothetical protein